jgi:hypothetical protein
VKDPRKRFLNAVRLRMRVAWLVATVQFLAPYAAGALVVVATIGWLTRLDGLLLPALAAVGVVLGVILVWAGVLRISEWDAARSAERGLEARDALTTALEFTDPTDPFHDRIQDRADRLVQSNRPRDAIRLITYRDRLRQTAILGAAALVIGIMPPLGSQPALSAGVQEALEAEAEEVERIADAVEAADVEESAQIAEELRRLAQELREVKTLEEAMTALDETEKRLEAGVDPKFLSQKAAAQGLARDLSLRPLTSGALDAASQFEELAGSLEELSEPELRALEDRLADLAASQAAGNAGLAGELTSAANALSAGDLAAASRALEQAAGMQREGLGAARGQQALSETARALDGVRARLAGQGQSDAEGGDGNGVGGQGQGQGEGQVQGEGQRQGEGQGQGQGSGQGGQAGQGGTPSGQISGVAPGDGNAAGQGGQGTVGSGPNADFGTNPETRTVYDPIDRGNLSDQIQVGIEGGSGDGAVIGEGDAPTTRGESIVPYTQVLPDYLSEAADTLTTLELPPSLRGIVQTYFDRLAQQAR